MAETNPGRRTPVGRDERRRARETRAVDLFGSELAPAALDLLELVELAWHDCYGEITPDEDVIDDIFVVSRGDLGGLVRAARLAVADRRDLRLAADTIRSPET